MNKLQHLQACKSFIRKVISHRRVLINKGKSYISEQDISDSIKQFDYFMGTIVSFDKMLVFIKKRETEIRRLIPSNKTAWKAELTGLIVEGNKLKQGACQKRLQFSAKTARV